jgi:hypothetical protein
MIYFIKNKLRRPSVDFIVLRKKRQKQNHRYDQDRKQQAFDKPVLPHLFSIPFFLSMAPLIKIMKNAIKKRP